MQHGNRSLAETNKVALKAIRPAAKERGYLKSLVQGGQWPQSRKYECGYAADRLRLRRGELGGLLHRH
eukprot:9387700-Pyramimonas_sp.AAC.1